jgi:uncharacterized phage protein (TIGR01671 family)
MREILFRGKRINNGEWMCGSLLKVTYDGNTYNLIFADNFLFVFGEATAMEHACVDPETIGQFTGLTDKNGKKIFEGDIVEVIHEGVYRCRWDEGNFEFGLTNGTESFGIGYISPHDIVVIGNIHDNPELLEEGADNA